MRNGHAIVDSDGHALGADARVAGERDEPRPIVIGQRVWIGLGAIILKGVTIGDDVVVGAGAVVSRSLPPRSLCVGQPARPVRDVS